MKSNKFPRIAIYFIIALLFSIIFRLKPIHLPDFYLSEYVYGLLGGAGPFIGAIVVLFLFKDEIKNNVTYKGVFSWLQILVLFLVPSALLCFFGTSSGSHLNGLLLGLYISIYSVLEERGWRGYLQSEFKSKKPILKYLIVSLFWYTWHLTFLGQTSFLNELVIFGILFLSSIGIGIMADRTKSIFFAACFHLIGNTLAFSSELTTYLTKDTRNITVAISIVVWLIAFFIAKRKKILSYTDQ
ncbi:type II CAAX prenyl endopeptidase Rce1 family protein [Chryseobacterium sp. SNU WT5]|uniref:CPBP family glutamic-type intramembrane protease n=1 Tax=Chryseobacterium sp. SNU WT5 TaxID=2594269 RepID=UPI001627194F|nr:CPBP family glutamic-type intramembrane protease [Chryseobacterium sp. SNU WT5]